MKKKSLLFDRTFWRIMVPLALPIALQNLLMTSFRLVDTLMVGRLGDVSIAAVGLAGYASFFVELVSFGMASGSAVFLAQYHGAGNLKGIRRTMGAMLMFVVPIGLLFTVLTMVFPDVVMRLFTDDVLLINEGVSYLRFACLSYVALTINMALGITLRCTESVRIPMWTSGICAVLNAILNYMFIFGFKALGIPAMGVAGAGLATAISSLANPLLVIIISVVKKNILIAPLSEMFALRGFLKQYWCCVLPVLMNEMLWSLSIVGINMVFGRMGTDNYAALTVERTIENIIFVFFVGICNACNILVGKSIGAGLIEQGKRYAKQFMMLIPMFGIVLGVVVILLRGPMVSLFDISDAAARTARIMLFIYAVDLSIRNIPYMEVVGIFRAGGDTKYGLLCDAAVQYIVVLPAVIFCGMVLKLPFLTTYIIMIVVDDVSKLCLTLPHFIRMKWIKPIRQENGFANVLPLSVDPLEKAEETRQSYQE
ncbi:MAG: MATE family efflux transporter [Clostridia bacterium]